MTISLRGMYFDVCLHMQIINSFHFIPFHFISEAVRFMSFSFHFHFIHLHFMLADGAGWRGELGERVREGGGGMWVILACDKDD